MYNNSLLGDWPNQRRTRLTASWAGLQSLLDVEKIKTSTAHPESSATAGTGLIGQKKPLKAWQPW